MLQVTLLSAFNKGKKKKKKFVANWINDIYFRVRVRVVLSLGLGAGGID